VERPDLLARFDQLVDTIRTFTFAAAIVDGADEPTLREIFVRTNKTGMQLRADEVFTALHTTEQETTIRAAVARLDELYGADDEWLKDRGEFFVRCLLSVADLDPGTNLRADGLGLYVIATEQALKCALEFLVADAFVPFPSTLPQIFPLLPLARFFALFPNPSSRTRLLLRRWFWRGMVSDAFTDNGFGAVRKLQAVIKTELGEESAASALARGLAYAGPFIEPPVHMSAARTS
jgi:hypothetical protein